MAKVPCPGDVSYLAAFTKTVASLDDIGAFTSFVVAPAFWGTTTSMCTVPPCTDRSLLTVGTL
jgi:hypothetical protein